MQTTLKNSIPIPRISTPGSAQPSPHSNLHSTPNHPMKILVACEESGIVRDSFIAQGHKAVSCDIIQTARPGPHFQCDVLDIIHDNWDMMIAFPPCTHLAVSGARWFPQKQQEQKDALKFVSLLLNAPISKIALENPVSIISTQIKKPSQIIQPWQFGHGEQKTTCLWLKGLPELRHTNIVSGRSQRIWSMSPSPNRARERSRTYSGIAEAMAKQWG